MKPGGKDNVMREGGKAGGADAIEGWDKFVEVCGVKTVWGKRFCVQQPSPNRPVIIIAIYPHCYHHVIITAIIIAITVDIIITNIISASSVSSSSSRCCQR